MKLQKLCVGAAPAQAGKRRAEDEESISKRRRGDEPLGGLVELGMRGCRTDPGRDGTVRY